MFSQIQIPGENTAEFCPRLYPVWKCTYLKITFHKSKGKRKKSPTTLILNERNFKELCSHILWDWNLLTVGWKQNLRRTLIEQSFMTSPWSRLSFSLNANSYSFKVLKTKIISETGDSPNINSILSCLLQNFLFWQRLPILEHQQWCHHLNKQNCSGGGQTATVILDEKNAMTHYGYPFN